MSNVDDLRFSSKDLSGRLQLEMWKVGSKFRRVNRHLCQTVINADPAKVICSRFGRCGSLARSQFSRATGSRSTDNSNSSLTASDQASPLLLRSPRAFRCPSGHRVRLVKRPLQHRFDLIPILSIVRLSAFLALRSGTRSERRSTMSVAVPAATCGSPSQALGRAWRLQLLGQSPPLTQERPLLLPSLRFNPHSSREPLESTLMGDRFRMQTSGYRTTSRRWRADRPAQQARSVDEPRDSAGAAVGRRSPTAAGRTLEDASAVDTRVGAAIHDLLCSNASVPSQRRGAARQDRPYGCMK